MSCEVMLCYFLCYVMLCYIVLYMLFYSMLCYVMFFFFYDRERYCKVLRATLKPKHYPPIYQQTKKSLFIFLTL